MANLNTLLSVLAISQLLFLGTYAYSNFGHHRLARLLTLFAICLGSYLLGQIPVISFNPIIDLIVTSLAILTPAALWVFSVSFFRDEKKIPPYGLSLILAYFILRTIRAFLIYLGYEQGQFSYYLGYLVPLLVMFGLSIHIVYMGIEGRKADLIEERRRIRVPFVISMGIVILFTLFFSALATFLELLSSSEDALPFFEVTDLIIVGFVFSWALMFNLSIFKLSSDAELLLQNAPRIDLGSTHNGEEVKVLSKEEKLKGKINEAMNEQKLYKETSFTIAILAYKLSAPEQRLRTTINKTMGFRNFNQFLNYYRIREASQLIAESDEPIANIAMDVGYNSISSFNKAFKENHGMPPREFRAGVLASRQKEMKISEALPG